MNSANSADFDAAGQPWRDAWRLRDDTIYLNHGSFGPPPIVVQEARERWQQQLDAQPMDFFLRRWEDELEQVRVKLGEFVGTSAGNLALVDNATFGMNVVAHSLSLSSGDEVLLTNHEYGAVRRIWQRACDHAGARMRIVDLPMPIESREQVVQSIVDAFTPRTRLLVISHITSHTALELPVQAISNRARAMGVGVCIDGPHAVAQLPLDIDALDCDFYTASCHKWLSAPLGTGFLYVNPRRQAEIRPPVLSWGKTNVQDDPCRWSEEFDWLGTRDPSALLAVPSAIEFLERVGLDAFRRQTRSLAQHAQLKLIEFTGQSPLAEGDHWYHSMAHAPLPAGAGPRLQQELWEEYHIEAPVIEFCGRRWIRVSCHLYTAPNDIEALLSALNRLL